MLLTMVYGSLPVPVTFQVVFKDMVQLLHPRCSLNPGTSNEEPKPQLLHPIARGCQNCGRAMAPQYIATLDMRDQRRNGLFLTT